MALPHVPLHGYPFPQVKTSGEFKAFDYGSKNQAVYHQVGVVVLVYGTSAAKPAARLTPKPVLGAVGIGEPVGFP